MKQAYVSYVLGTCVLVAPLLALLLLCTDFVAVKQADNISLYTGLTPDTKSGNPRPSFLDVPSHTLPTVELLVSSEQAKTYGASFRC